jgi:hypothetical protein
VASPTNPDPFLGLPDADRLRQVRSLAGAIAAEPLSGGITNRNYKVTLASGPVVVRAYEHESSALAINRENEHLNSVAAAESGAGASVIEYLPVENMLIVGWIEGRTFSEADVRIPENLPRIAEACRVLHAGPRFVNDFNMFAIQARYLALVRGVPRKAKDRLATPLVDLHGAFGVPQEAATRYELLRSRPEAALVACFPETGRLHQIRRHFEGVRHPLAGDPKYGDPAFDALARREWGLERLFLHAAAITFPHPRDGVKTTLEAPLAPELEAVLERAGLGAT